MLAAITFGSNRQLLSSLTTVCAELPGLCVYKTLLAYPTPYELGQLMDVFSPEVVFLDIESSETALTVARQIRACHPKSAIVGYARHCEEQQKQQAMGAGVNEILLAPFPGQEFQQAVARAVDAQIAGVPDNVVAFLPAKAGSGSTTTVLHVAASLAQDCRRKTLVLEGDLQSGPLAVMLGLEPEHSIIDALENSQFLNEHLWSTLPSKALGFDLLPMPGIKKMGTVSRWEYQRLLTFARPRYDTVILDLPELVSDATEAVVTQAKAIYIVCTPEKASLFLARRRVDELTFRSAPEERLHIVLNRWERESSPGADPKAEGAARAQEAAKLQEVEQFLQRKVSLILPNDDSYGRKTALDSRLVSRESELGRAFASFARMVAGLKPLLPPPPPSIQTERRAGLRLLLNRVLHHS